MTKARDNATQGGSVLLASASVSAASELIIDNVFSTRYKTYLMIIERLVSSSATSSLNMQLRYLSSGTMTTLATNYFTGNINTDISGSSANATNSTNTSSFALARRVGDSGGTYRAGSGQFYIYRVGNGVDYPVITGQYTGSESTNKFTNNVAGYNELLLEHLGIRITASAGNITGTVDIYGLK